MARARPSPLLACAVLGFAGGLRTTAPHAALAAAGKTKLPHRYRWAPFAAAAGEVVVDKLPQTPSRTDPRGLVLRALSSAAAGRVLAGVPGAACAAATSLAGAFSGFHLRRAAGSRTGVPDPALGGVEDLLTAGVAFAGVRLAA